MGRSSGDPSRNWIFGSQAENERVSAGRADRARDRENQPPYFLVQGARAAITLIYAERYSPKRITGVVVRRSDQAVVDSSKRRGPEDDPFGPNHRSGRGIKTAPGWGALFSNFYDVIDSIFRSILAITFGNSPLICLPFTRITDQPCFRR